MFETFKNNKNNYHKTPGCSNYIFLQVEWLAEADLDKAGVLSYEEFKQSLSEVLHLQRFVDSYNVFSVSKHFSILKLLSQMYCFNKK